MERQAARDALENIEEPSIVFGAGEKTFGANNEFELEIQRPLEEGEVAATEEQAADVEAHDDGAGVADGNEEDISSIYNDFYKLPPLDPDLEEMLYDQDVVEIDRPF